MIPACARPTAWVLVIATGPSKVPDSLIQETPVISPLPFWEWKAGRHRIAGPGRAARVDGGDAGADPVALDQREVADLDPGHVGDGVQRAGLAAERDPERAGPRLAAGRG